MSTNGLPPILEGALAPMTDTGNAERFVLRYKDTIRWCQPWKKWVVYNGKFWERDEYGLIGPCAKETIRSIYVEASTLANDDDCKKLVNYGLKSESSGAVSAMLEQAKREKTMIAYPAQFNTQKHLLNCHNGTINLMTGELYAHNPLDFLTSCANANYDPTADCPKWKAFLDAIFEHNTELISYIQQTLGMSLSGNIRERIFFVCYGTGRNGKSTLLETVGAILGSYAQSTEIETFMLRKTETISDARAKLFGSRLVRASEPKIGAQLNTALIKKIIGGEIETVRFLNSNLFDFQPEYTIWLGVNHLPTIKDTTDSIWDRLRYIPFNVRFEVNHPDPEKRLVPEMTQKLLDAERDGIFSWLVDGCVQWYQAEYLVTPDIVLSKTGEYRSSMDAIGKFLQECCKPTTEKKQDVQAKVLHEAYKSWCDEENVTAESLTAFGYSMKERGYKKYKLGCFRYSDLALADVSLSDTAQKEQILYNRDEEDTSSREKTGYLDTLDSSSIYSAPRIGFSENEVKQVSKVSKYPNGYQDQPEKNQPWMDLTLRNPSVSNGNDGNDGKSANNSGIPSPSLNGQHQVTEETMRKIEEVVATMDWKEE